MGTPRRCSPMLALNMLLHGLKSSDATMQQNALGALCVAGGYELQYRMYIARHAVDALSVLIRLLRNKNSSIVHNTSLLLGQCCVCSVDFRRELVRAPGAVLALVALLDAAKHNAGVVCNASWVLKELLADPDCGGVDDVAVEQMRRALPSLGAQADSRIQMYASILRMALPEQKKEAKAPPTLGLRREKSLQAICALATLASG